MGSSRSDKAPVCEDVTDNVIKDHRLKKRELDRKAQRMSRERTKNRIKQLEDMVAHLKKDDTDSRVLSLMDHLSQATSERDKMLNVLESLAFTVNGHIQDAKRGADRSPTVETIPALPLESQHVADSALYLGAHAASISTADASDDLIDPQLWLDQDLGVSNPCGGLSNGDLFGDFLTSSAPFQDITLLPTLLDPLPYHISPLEDIIIPKAPPKCPCAMPASGDSPPDINLWRAANEALARPTAQSQSGISTSDADCEDTVIRAVVEGWSSVENKGGMMESWCKLRKLDDMGWHKCRPTERLAVLRFICLMIDYHNDPSPRRQAALPRWLWTRPSQTLPHSRCIDFFVWPALRERFIFFQHQYCGNLFWHLVLSNLRIVWPYDFRDTYMQNAETGKFHLSPHFKHCIGELGSWTMEAGFFEQFPELYDDIAVYSGG
ncbi:hypothetical protein AUP68_02493 [Ilyonectria robusta]